MKTKSIIRSIVLVMCLASCNSAFVYKTAKGSELGYTGSFASKASKEDTVIHLANGASIEKHIENKDEVESIKTLGRLALGKYSVGKAAEVSTNATNQLSN